ncbi:MAG TPA: hypothetical protein VJS91_00390 [Nitrososphaeraceae archaeon]|nr:hypothetical protein [Nitrososphaeraceae archaeon]
MVFRSNNKYNSEPSSRLLGVLGKKKILIVIIIAITAIGFGICFFSMNENNISKSTSDFVPPNCYIINGKRICPTVTDNS